MSACNPDLLVRVCGHLPLLKPHPKEGDAVDVPARSTQINPLVNPLVAASAAALANALIASMDICFCCADEPTMELIVLVCCKKTLHKQCVLTSLGMSSQCVYCRAMLDISKVLDYPIIDRSVGLSVRPTSTCGAIRIAHSLVRSKSHQKQACNQNCTLAGAIKIAPKASV